MIDNIYPINGYPTIGELTTISEGICMSTGGAVCNVGIDLAVLDPNLPIMALGLVGDDENGNYIVNCLKKYNNLDISQIIKKGKTSFTTLAPRNLKVVRKILCILQIVRYSNSPSLAAIPVRDYF